MIGGAKCSRLFLDRADRIELTEVHIEAEGDASVPAFDGLARNRARGSCERSRAPAYSFVTLERTE